MVEHLIKNGPKRTSKMDSGLTLVQRIKASSIGACLSTLLTTPFDVVKTRLQAQHRPLNIFVSTSPCHFHLDISPHSLWLSHLHQQNFTCSAAAVKETCLRCCMPAHIHTHVSSTVVGVKKESTLHMLRYIVRTEGAPSLWSGLTPSLMMAVPASVIYYSLMDTMCIWMGYSAAARVESGREWVPPVAGALSRSIAVIITQPLEVIRTRLQLRQTSAHELYLLLRRDGWLAFQRGLRPTLFRDIPFSAIFWGVFETCKRLHVKHAGGGELHAGQVHLNFLPASLFGALAGLFSALATQPFDVIKTHRQVELGESSRRSRMEFQSTRSALYDLYTRRGAAALFSGSVPRVMKILPACAIMVGSFEYLKLSYARSTATSATDEL